VFQMSRDVFANPEKRPRRQSAARRAAAA
jgi:hypothetical protein